MNRNLEAIAIAAARECERQHVDEDALIRLLTAHRYASENADRLPFFEDVLTLGELIEPVRYDSIIRNTPVTFTAGNRSEAIPAQLVRPSLALMFQLLSADTDKDEFTKAFLDIHPFRDGNGRTAWVLLNWLRGTLGDPLPLPDYYDEQVNA